MVDVFSSCALFPIEKPTLNNTVDQEINLLCTPVNFNQDGSSFFGENTGSALTIGL